MSADDGDEYWSMLPALRLSGQGGLCGPDIRKQ